jgi:hypothetical protein
LLNSCLFVVKDINQFLDVIKKNGFPNINEGVQSARGEVNEMDSFLSNIERDYLEYLYQNHVYHFNIANRNILPRSKFSLRNIRKISKSFINKTAASMQDRELNINEYITEYNTEIDITNNNNNIDITDNNETDITDKTNKDLITTNKEFITNMHNKEPGNEP